LNVPGALDTLADGIDGDTILGQYYNGSAWQGFIATPVPEPASGVFLAAGLAAFFVRRRFSH
jgi:hypothetical protein